MKIESKKLAKALSGAVRCAGAHTLPELSNGIRLRGQSGELAITATDLEISRSLVIEAEEAGEQPFDLVVDGALLLKFAKGAGAQVSLSFDFGERLLVKSGRSRLTLKAISGDLYPFLPVAKGEVSNIDPEALRAALSVAYAASTDPARPNLASVSLSHMGAASTDGHRLALWERGGLVEGSGLVSASHTRAILEALGEEGAEVSLHPTQLLIESESATTLIRLVDAKFPDVARVIPANEPLEIWTLPRELTLSALKRIALVSGEVVISTQGDHLHLSAQGDGIAEEEIPCKCSLKRQIKLSVPYLTQALKALEAEEIDARYHGPELPLAIRSGEALSLIMPMVLK
jgi:DNA polymerase III sliding clamp (beta) subunit (PCNA family)